MDPDYNLQDLIRCHLCETPDPSLHCDSCENYLCEACRREHLSNTTKEHTVVPFEERKSTPKCKVHSLHLCKKYCEQCRVPICVHCASSKEHRNHEIADMVKKLECPKKGMKSDLEELENLIFPRYEEIASSMKVQKADLHNTSQTLITTINKHGETWHKEIDILITKLKSEVDEMYSNHLTVRKKEIEIKSIISKIKQIIADLKNSLNSIDVNIVSDYISRNGEFKRLPPKLTVTLPSFNTREINKEELYQQFGSLSSPYVKTEERGYIIDSSSASSSSRGKPLIDVPLVITELDTKNRGLRIVSCLINENIWSCCDDNIIRLFNLLGGLLESIQTKSRIMARDIAVTWSDDLVYTDDRDRTVNIVKNTQIKTLIRLRGWKPSGICSTSYGDLLVVMESDSKQTKVVRYTGSEEKQSIQFNEKGKPLYSSGGGFKYISENRNLDICVADCKAGKVVVVNQNGNFRFIYSGSHYHSKKLFDPYGITTDSHSRILTADHSNHRIHILDKDGQFLRYIDNCHLNYPWGLCVDTNDNLFVAENITSKVKKIKYYP